MTRRDNQDSEATERALQRSERDITALKRAGIAPEQRDRIFDRFERATSTTHYGGFGLGLYITRAIVEAHGGTIGVESAPGGGSTFRVEMPVARPTRRRAAGAGSAEGAPP